MYMQDVDNVYDLEWVDGVTYGDVFHQNEVEQSHYNFEVADTAMLFQAFDAYEKEAVRVLEAGYVLPAYDWVLKCSHTFNLLDAAGSDQRHGADELYRARAPAWPGACAESYLESRERLGFPLLAKANQEVAAR